MAVRQHENAPPGGRNGGWDFDRLAKNLSEIGAAVSRCRGLREIDETSHVRSCWIQKLELLAVNCDVYLIVLAGVPRNFGERELVEFDLALPPRIADVEQQHDGCGCAPLRIRLDGRSAQSAPLDTAADLTDRCRQSLRETPAQYCLAIANEGGSDNAVLLAPDVSDRVRYFRSRRPFFAVGTALRDLFRGKRSTDFTRQPSRFGTDHLRLGGSRRGQRPTVGPVVVGSLGALSGCENLG